MIFGLTYQNAALVVLVACCVSCLIQHVMICATGLALQKFAERYPLSSPGVELAVYLFVTILGYFIPVLTTYFTFKSLVF